MTFTDAQTSERCTAVVTLRDGTTADCGRRGTGDPRRCWQHVQPKACPFCEHMPDNGIAQACESHRRTADQGKG